jgi:DNA-3-methyladenine glycosylase
LLKKLMKTKKIERKFFERDAATVAKDLLGKILVRNLDGKLLRARIIETEAYYGEDDPASWARFGKRKDNRGMWGKPGTILVKNVHKYFMLNFVTGEEGEASAVLIRALEPINFKSRCNGPGLLTLAMGIDKIFNGKDLFNNKYLFLEEGFLEGNKIGESFRIGVSEDLPEKLRFYALSE